MVSVVCANALNRAVKEFKLVKPSEILDKVRELIIETFERSETDVKDGMDISLCALNLETKKLEWSGANNPLWIIRDGGNEVEEFGADRQPVGKHTVQHPFKNHHINLNKNDQLYIFTDGYLDQFGGEKGKKFKAANLKKVLLENAKNTTEEQHKKLYNHFEIRKSDFEQVDDVCIIGVKI